MLKVTIFGILAVLLAVQLKSMKTEYAVFILFTAGIVLGGWILSRLFEVVAQIRLLEAYMPSGSPYLKILLKIIGITYVAEFGADLCKDAGYSGIASQIELFGKLSILVLCMPVLSALLETLERFLGG